MLSSLFFTPICGMLALFAKISLTMGEKLLFFKRMSFVLSIFNLIFSLVYFIFLDLSSNHFQFVHEFATVHLFEVYLGIDGISVFFVLLTTVIMPIAILSGWNSTIFSVKLFLTVLLILEGLLLAVFLVIDVLLFYVCFESILPPLFILIGIFGASNRVKAGFSLFLYTLLGSLFLLLSLLFMSSGIGTSDLESLFKSNFLFLLQIFLFIGIFIAFAVKTPVWGLQNWLLKAHVESPLGGSIVLAAIVLKLSLYGIFRLILPLVPKVLMTNTFIVYGIGVISVLYASISTLRTIDVKELVAYSSVAHASVYLMSAFSNTIQGIEGSILLGLGHGFVSSGLFICVGGVLYDRTGTRDISFYKGIVQMMPVLAILFFILSLGNCGAPLTLNFIGEFLSLYGIVERLPVLGVIACSSIIFSAAYTIYMYNRIMFGGSFSKYLDESLVDVNKREFWILFILVAFTVILGIYPSILLDGLHFNVGNLIYSVGGNIATESNGFISNGTIPSGIRYYSSEASKSETRKSYKGHLTVKAMEEKCSVKKTMYNETYYKRLTKHLTFLNFKIAFTSLLLGVLFKFLLLPLILDYFSLDLADMYQNILSGALIIMVKLAIRGIFEEISEHYPQHIMLMDTGGSNESFASQSSQPGPSHSQSSRPQTPNLPGSSSSPAPSEQPNAVAPSSPAPSEQPNAVAPSNPAPSEQPNAVAPSSPVAWWSPSPSPSEQPNAEPHSSPLRDGNNTTSDEDDAPSSRSPQGEPMSQREYVALSRERSRVNVELKELEKKYDVVNEKHAEEQDNEDPNEFVTIVELEALYDEVNRKKAELESIEEKLGRRRRS